MRVHLGADHAGYELKNHLVTWLREHGHEPVDQEFDRVPAGFLRHRGKLARQAIATVRNGTGADSGRTSITPGA